MMIKIPQYCGYLFVGLSLVLQILIRVTALSLSQKQELAAAVKQSSGAGIFFMIATSCFAMLISQMTNSALTLQRMGLAYAAAFAFWCVAAMVKETDSGKRGLYGEMRSHCLYYTVIYCVLSYLLV